MNPSKLFFAVISILELILFPPLGSQRGVFACAPVAQFVASTTQPCEGDTVQFTDQSTNTPTSWSWSFTGGTPNSSILKNPVIVYNVAGTYNVTLTATNGSGSDVETKINYISVGASAPPIANFVASSTTICQGQSVTFTDQSTICPNSWSWSFPGGNPSSSTNKNPTVQYNTSGIYDVTLITGNPYGSDTILKTGYITVDAPLPPAYPSYTWANSIGGGGGSSSNSIAVDGSGNVHITGYFQGTVDFDPGAGTANLTSSSPADIFVGKYTSAGNYLWAFKISEGLTGGGVGEGIAVDSSGNVFVTGYFGYTVDFDPGPGVANLTGAGNTGDIFVAKYTPAGNYLWAFRIGGVGGSITESGYDITVDGSGNVLVTGSFRSTTDFNPGAGTANLIITGGDDIFVAKYSSAGAYLWAFGIGTANSDIGYGIAVDGSGNVLVTGRFDGTADFDPGAGVANLNSGGNYNIFVAKYDASGTYQWAFSSITGFGEGHGIAVDGSGNVLVTGWFGATVDFDPGAGTANLTSAGNGDIFVAKYTALSVYQWAFKIGSTLGNDRGYDIAVDGSSNVFVTGNFYNTADFDPGGCTINLTSPGTIYVAKYDSAGIYLCAGNIGGGTGYASGNGIALDGSGNIHVTGSFGGTADFDPGADTANLNSAGNPAIFFAKYGSCIAILFSPTANFTGNPTTICEGDTVIFTDQSTNTPTSWAWTFAGGTPATSTLQNPTITYNTPGTYDVTLIATNADGSDTLIKTNYITVLADSLCGGSSGCNESIPATVQNNPATVQNNPATVQNNPATTETSPATIQNNPASIVTVLCLTSGCSVSAIISGDTVICNGDSTTLTVSGGTSYLWNTGDTTAIITVNPSTTTNYYAIATTDTCVDTAWVTITVNTNPTPTITAGGPTTFCAGDSVQLTASAAASYSWSTGATLQSITATDSGIYTVTVTDSNGCSGIASDTVIVNSPPVAIISGDTDICVGDTTTLFAAGGISFQWSTGDTGDSIQVSPASPTSYSLTVTDNNGCTNDTTLTVTLSPNPSVALIGPSTMCNGDSASLIAGGGVNYQWSTGETNDTIWVNPPATTTYIVTVTDADGCSDTSVITITIDSAIVAVINGDTSLCTGDSTSLTVSGGSSFLWSTGSTSSVITVIPSADSVFSVTVTSASCSDSTNVTVIVNPNPAAIINSSADTVCLGSVVILAASGGTNYQWSTGAINDTITVTPASDSTFYVTVTNSFGCDSTVATSITVNPTATATATATICQSDSIFLQNAWQTAAGTYYDTLTASNGCDSIIVTDLIVNPKYFNTFSASICQGDSIYVNGFWLNTAGTYSDSLLSVNGCDSISELQLAVFPTATATASANICNGDSIFLSGSWQTTAGTYYDTLTAANGCDSILATTLSVPSAITLTLNSTDASCGNADGNASVTASGGVTPYTYQWDGPVPPYGGTSGGWNSADSLTAGTYTVTVTDSSSCQQTATVNISNAGPPDATISSIINVTCNGGNDGSATVSATGGTLPYSYLWSPTGGIDSTATGLPAGTYTVTITDNAGCLEIVDTTISEPALIQNSTATNICTGDSIFLSGSWQTTAGTYYDTLSAIGGCDSILTTTLSVNNNITIPLTAAICDGDSMFLQDNYQTTAGTYYDTLTAANGCDSILATTLSVDSSIFNSTATSICPGDSIQLPGGNWANSAGVYSDTLTASAGCDSIVQTNLTVNTSYNIPLNASICTGDSIFLQGNYQTAAGNYSDTLTSVNGCDSILSITLSIDSAIFNTVAAFICPDDSIQLPDGNWVNTAGVYNDTLTASAGCDSIIQTTLSVNTSYNIPLNASICTGDSIFLQGSYQTTTGTYYDTLTSANGCDSILATTVSVVAAYYNNMDATICQGDSIFLNDSWQNTQGTYNDTLSSTGNCDSIIITSLTVNPVFQIPASTRICYNDSVLISGEWVNVAGTYYDSLLTASGCDSIIAISLTIDSIPVVTIGNDTTITSGISIQIVATGGISYLWSNGETNPGITVSPEESTTYYVTVSDANGCAVTDSVKITVDISKCTVFVPTIFTPNGDGKNDVLYVRGYGLKELEFMIYDRWGEKVFEYSGSPLPSGGVGGGPGWDGSFQKKEMNTAVFVYMLKAVCFNGELIEEKGNITLVK